MGRGGNIGEAARSIRSRAQEAGRSLRQRDEEAAARLRQRDEEAARSVRARAHDESHHDYEQASANRGRSGRLASLFRGS